jgi:hypothetical protein
MTLDERIGDKALVESALGVELHGFGSNVDEPFAGVLS